MFDKPKVQPHSLTVPKIPPHTVCSEGLPGCRVTKPHTHPAPVTGMTVAATGSITDTDPILAVLKSIDAKLAQLHVCDHGTRGFCPSCYVQLRESL